ncbi:IS66 family insertion sequence element accessory protein TnpA [Photobacterium atrarenae]|uniref:Transposase n=1 Tax=Photobacterium atrarenae TaxID=865757 RepID=A0ABY5GCP9_9GAMM|nr:hypothetical protein [Photobacterium atrarenae]UTV26976.1 hypothetical protein NNL38_11540 [Photobacterium atrarenae]
MTREDKMQLWQERLQHQKDSELTIAAWCDLHQIAQSQFYYWQKKRTATPSEPDSVIAPVPVPSSSVALVVKRPVATGSPSMTPLLWHCCRKS